MAAAAGLAGLLHLAYGDGYLGYDAAYALLWGDDLAAGRAPALDAPFAPTSHPLANLVGVLLAPLGNDAAGALHLVVLGSFAALGVLCFLLASELISRPAGLLLAAIVLTREPLVTAMLDTSLDIPFLALVILAAWLEARRSPAAAVAAPLVAAGLLRPEAWLILAAYAAYRVWIRADRPWRWGLAAAAAPAIWAGFDLVATGDALHSLHGTRELADTLERPRSAEGAPELLAGHLVTVLREPVAWGGAAAGIAAAWLMADRLRVPLALLLLGLLGFLLLGLAGLPLLTRYVLIPAVMLALLFCAGVFGARHVQDAGARRAWSVAGVGLAAALLAFGPSDVRRLRDTVELADARGLVQRDLETIAGSAEVARCSVVELPGHRPLPLMARLISGRPQVRVAAGAAPDPGVATVVPESPGASAYGSLTAASPPPPLPAAGAEVLVRTPSWTVAGRCG